MKKIILLFVMVISLQNICLPQEQEWKPLFNGKDLDGWEHIGPGEMVIEDGNIKTVGGMGLLWYTREKFQNVEIKVIFTVEDNNVNSGVFIRIPEPPADPWEAVNSGYEVQIDNGMRHLQDDYHVTGVLYSLTKAMAYPQKRPGEWNEMRIILDGPITIVYVNDKKVTHYAEGQPVPPEKRWFEPDRGPRPLSGYIGIQNHDDQSTAYFREISVRSLNSAQ
jgi:hypothetical protein